MLLFPLCLCAQNEDFNQTWIEDWASGVEKVQQENVAEALMAYTKAVEKTNGAVKYPFLLLERGELYKILGDYESSLNDLNRAIPLLKKKKNLCKHALVLRSQVYLALHEVEKARADIKRFSKINPGISDGESIGKFAYFYGNPPDEVSQTLLAQMSRKLGVTNSDEDVLVSLSGMIIYRNLQERCGT